MEYFHWHFVGIGIWRVEPDNTRYEEGKEISEKWSGRENISKHSRRITK